MSIKALIIVRALELDSEGNECPEVPSTWTLQRSESLDGYGQLLWFSIWRDFENDRDRFVNALWVRDSTGQPMKQAGFGVFCICSDDLEALRWLRDHVTHAYTIKQIRNEVTAVAKAIKDAWLDDRTDPGQELAALRQTVHGFDYPDAAETTEPGDIDAS